MLFEIARFLHNDVMLNKHLKLTGVLAHKLLCQGHFTGSKNNVEQNSLKTEDEQTRATLRVNETVTVSRLVD